MARGRVVSGIWTGQLALAFICVLNFSLTAVAQTSSADTVGLQRGEGAGADKNAAANSSNGTNSDNGKNSDGKQQAIETGVQVFLPPVLEKGKPFWGSIYDSTGNMLAEQKIQINKSEVTSDDYGSFSFTAPETETVTFCIPGGGSKRNWEITYVSTLHGLLVADKDAAAIVDNLDEISGHGSDEPIISHAPSVVEPQQTIVVIGKNFSGKQGDDDVEIDDREADMLAASPRSIVAVSHQFLDVGPIKEMVVFRRDCSSLPTEVDVSRAYLNIESGSQGKNKLRINVAGSTLPLAVALSNDSTSGNVRFGGWRLGRKNVFLSPGGATNHFAVDIDSTLPSEAMSARIISNGVFDPYSLKASRNLLPKNVADAGEKAEVLRLKRREIGLEMQQAAVNRERTAIEKEHKMTVPEEHRLEASESSISARLFRVEKMLQARRAVLEGSGMNDYRKLLDTAANGTITSLESVIATKDLGFTEARLLKVVGRRAEEQRTAHANSIMYTGQYKTPPAAVLQSLRKKYGKRGYVPPPPDTMVLVAPPAPYSPGQNELGPFLTDVPAPLKKVKSTAASKPSSGNDRISAGSKRKKSKHGARQIAVDTALDKSEGIRRASAKHSAAHSSGLKTSQQSSKTHAIHKLGWSGFFPHFKA